METNRSEAETADWQDRGEPSTPDPEDLLLGALTPTYPPCPKHRETYHDADGSPHALFCNRCGWNREQGVQHNKPNGGWA